MRTSLGAADAPIARELRLRRGEIALLLSNAALIKIACSRGMAGFMRAIISWWIPISDTNFRPGRGVWLDFSANRCLC